MNIQIEINSNDGILTQDSAHKRSLEERHHDSRSSSVDGDVECKKMKLISTPRHPVCYFSYSYRSHYYFYYCCIAIVVIIAVILSIQTNISLLFFTHHKLHQHYHKSLHALFIVMMYLRVL